MFGFSIDFFTAQSFLMVFAQKLMICLFPLHYYQDSSYQRCLASQLIVFRMPKKYSPHTAWPQYNFFQTLKGLLWWHKDLCHHKAATLRAVERSRPKCHQRVCSSAIFWRFFADYRHIPPRPHVLLTKV